MQLSQAIDGFLLFKEAAGLRPRTLSLYRYYLYRFSEWTDNLPVERITANDINAFLAFLRADYKPARLSGNTRPLSSQSIYNNWTALKAFTRWTHETLALPDIMSNGQVPRPKATNEIPNPFTETEIKSLFAVVKPVRGRRATSGLYYLIDLRDRAFLFVLLDTGMRAGELCRLTVGDVHIQSGRVVIQEGKGGKGRVVWLGSHSRPAVWRYLQERPDIDPAAPLFASSGSRPFSISALEKRLHKIGARAKVEDVRPHRFRHTFAIEYLRNGGDVFTLQALLGHSSLAMVQRYLKLAQSDTETAHRRASPVDKWFT